MSQRAVEPAIKSKHDYAKEQNDDIAAVLRQLEVVSTVMAETKALEGGNKSTSWELSSAQKQAEEADKNLMYARQRIRDVKASEAEARTKVTIQTKLGFVPGVSSWPEAGLFLNFLLAVYVVFLYFLQGDTSGCSQTLDFGPI